MTTIELTAAELLHAAQAGAMRQVQNLRVGRRDRYGAASDPWGMHVRGACAECAVAKYLGRYWDGMGALGDLHANDVRGVQVRFRTREDYDLIVHPEDADDVPFVLVTGGDRRFHLRGWIVGAAAKQDRFWADPAGGRAAFFVPAAELREMSTLGPWLELPF